MKSKTLKVDEDSANKRVDAFLADHLGDKSRGYWQKMIENQKVLLNGSPTTSSKKTADNDVVTILPAPKAKKIDFPIIYKDEQIVVIDKPSGVLTHSKGEYNAEYTVADFAQQYTEDDTKDRPGIVHRLDRDTSGVLIIARTKGAKLQLQRQFSNRTVKKVYIALVEGVVKEDNGEIDVPLQRNPKNPKTFTAHQEGKQAITNFKVLKRFKKNTLLELTPKTGRTHQLRAHLKYIDKPIVCDKLYGSSKHTMRLFLHAASLDIHSPKDNTRMKFESELPEELKSYLEQLK